MSIPHYSNAQRHEKDLNNVKFPHVPVNKLMTINSITKTKVCTCFIAKATYDVLLNDQAFSGIVYYGGGVMML